MAVTDGMTRLTKGIWWGIAPKIGEPSLIIDVVHVKGSWQFSRAVAWAVRERRGSELWFQCVKNGEWMWAHGLVNSSGRITQVG